MKDRFDVRTYQFDAATSYFLDANIWFYVYGPLPPADNWKAKVYSSAWKRLRSSGAPVFVDVLVVSEIMNAWARAEYKRAGGDQAFGGFKAFRNSPSFASVGQEILIALRAILKHTKRTGTPFANIDVEPILEECTRGALDFADALISESCRQKSFTLLTHDADMKDRELILVTANPALLA